MLTGAKQWGPLPVLETGREDTSDCQVSRGTVLICSDTSFLASVCLSFACTCGLGGGQTVHICGGQRTDSLWEATPSTMCAEV